MNITEISDFAAMAAKEEEDLDEFFATLKLEDWTQENALLRKMAIRRSLV